MNDAEINAQKEAMESWLNSCLLDANEELVQEGFDLILQALNRTPDDLELVTDKGKRLSFAMACLDRGDILPFDTELLMELVSEQIMDVDDDRSWEMRGP